MTLDKFGRHTSKRVLKDLQTLENKIYLNIGKVQNVGVNLERKLDDLSKRVGENDETLQNISRNNKLIEEEMSDLKEKIKNLKTLEYSINRIIDNVLNSQIQNQRKLDTLNKRVNESDEIMQNITKKSKLIEDGFNSKFFNFENRIKEIKAEIQSLNKAEKNL